MEEVVQRRLEEYPIKNDIEARIVDINIQRYHATEQAAKLW